MLCKANIPNIPSGITWDLIPFYILCRVLISTRNSEVVEGSFVATEIVPLHLLVQERE